MLFACQTDFDAQFDNHLELMPLGEGKDEML